MLDHNKPSTYASQAAPRVRHLASRIAAQEDRRLATEAERRRRDEEQRLERARKIAEREAADTPLAPRTMRCGGCRRNRWAVVIRPFARRLSQVLIDSSGNTIGNSGGYPDWNRAREMAKFGERVVNRQTFSVDEAALCSACKDGETRSMLFSGLGPLSAVPPHPVGTEYTTEEEWA